MSIQEKIEKEIELQVRGSTEWQSRGDLVRGISFCKPELLAKSIINLVLAELVAGKCPLVNGKHYRDIQYGWDSAFAEIRRRLIEEGK